MGDLQEAVAPMVQTLRSNEPLEPTDRNQLIMWLETFAGSLERMDTLMSAIEAKIVTREHLAEPEWLRDSGEAVP
jgi:hypothetical protein